MSRRKILSDLKLPSPRALWSQLSEVEAFLDEVRVELTRARTKFPGDRIMTIALAEEFGELCKAILDEPRANVRKEAVQTAVMAARVVLDGDGSVNAWRAERGLDPLIPDSSRPSTANLTDGQAAWLRAFEHEPPVEMAWLDAEHRDVTGPPETWVWLSARWANGATAVIHADERAGIADLFAPGSWSLTEAGRSALQEASRAD